MSTHEIRLVMTSDETQLQMFADWWMSHAKRVVDPEQQEKSANSDVEFLPNLIR